MKKIKMIAKQMMIRGEIIKCFLSLMFLKKRLVVFDTPSHANIGDQAILLAEVDFLSRLSKGRRIICIPHECTEKIVGSFPFLLKYDKVLFIHGGGFLGSIWKDEVYPQVIKMYPEKEIVILPQTVYYENDIYGKDKFNREKNLFDSKNVQTFVREEQSQQFMIENMIAKFPENCKLVPDIVLTYNVDIKNQSNKTIIMCFRRDKEKESSDALICGLYKLINEYHYSCCETDMCIDRALRTFKKKRSAVQQKMRQLAESKFVVTDRLHCMIFCTLVGTPCIALDNSSKKVKGVYKKWLADLDYIEFCVDENDALTKVKEWIEADHIKVTRYSTKALEKDFGPLVEVVKKFA